MERVQVAKTYLEQEVTSAHEQQSEGDDLKYFKHLVDMLNKSSNSASELNKLLADVSLDKEDADVDLSKVGEVLDSLSELVIMLKNAGELREEEEGRKKELKEKEKEWKLRKATEVGAKREEDEVDLDTTPEKYQELFERVEKAKQELSYREAKSIGYEGSFEDFVAQLA
eukprot:augustus_masked-scaffold_8-processed-gene-3.12-mRNA-1 protein AED:1.00 eAED:1.00 QI:0/-1/0/0/-1/1/1/0/169